MKFEKWQALGNDYLIIESESLPWSLTPERIRLLCDPHFGPGSDGILLLLPVESSAVARLMIFNPDGSEAELSGNGAREAALYLRHRGWTSENSFTIETLSGAVQPVLTGDEDCEMELGIARTHSSDWPDGPNDGRTTVPVNGSDLEARHINVGNPQLAVRCPDPTFVDELDLELVGPPLQEDSRFPNRTNVSFWAPTGETEIRARIFERGVGETLSSGTGACGSAVAAHLEGMPSQLTVQLDGGELVVDISPTMGLKLRGWARPIYSAVLAPEMIVRLDECN